MVALTFLQKYWKHIVIVGMLITILIMSARIDSLNHQLKYKDLEKTQLEQKLRESISYSQVLNQALDKQSKEIQKLADEAKLAKAKYNEWLKSEKKYKDQIQSLLNNKDNSCEGLKKKIQDMGKVRYEDL